MRVRRICHRRFARRAFDGEGSRTWGGRWNLPGQSLVYASPALSLASLELFVNLAPAAVPEELVAVEAALPEDVVTERIEVISLPSNWRTSPPPIELQEIGSTWLQSRRTAVLFVPSAVIPEEFNVLINPAHPDFAKLQVGRPRRFQFDPRMWKGR